MRDVSANAFAFSGGRSLSWVNLLRSVTIFAFIVSSADTTAAASRKPRCFTLSRYRAGISDPAAPKRRLVMVDRRAVALDQRTS